MLSSELVLGACQLFVGEWNLFQVAEFSENQVHHFESLSRRRPGVDAE